MAALRDQLRLVLLRRRLQSLDARLMVAVARREKACREEGSCVAEKHNEHVCAVLATARAVALAKIEDISKRAR